jgi:hypothetical protein
MTPAANPPIGQLTNFKGWWDRGSIIDCPSDYLATCKNCTFNNKDVGIRGGLTSAYTLNNNCVAFFAYSTSVATAAAGKNILYMDGSGNLYNENTNTLLHTFTGATDFVALELFGRVYISAKVNGLALPSEFIYYWDGSNFRKIAGAGPSSNITLAQVNPGIVNAGVHYVAVSFQYATGYLSPPYAFSSLSSINSTGSNDIELSTIPTGPAGVVARVLLMTVAGGTQLFFVPGGTINDNTTTTATINVYDTSLLQDASYLYNIVTEFPSVSHIGFYNGRAIFVGPVNNSVPLAVGTFDPSPFQVFTSDVDIFDSINIINNIINTPKDNYLNSPNSSLVINGVMYILKPYGTFSTQDNGSVPNTWNLLPVDSSLGGYDSGISVFSSGLSGSDIFNISVILHPRGILLFNGAYSDPPLSYSIEDFWTSQQVPLNQIKIAHDPINKAFYILIVGAVTSNIVYADYSDGLTPNTIKFSFWEFSGSTVVDVVEYSDQAGNYQILFVDSTAALYNLNITHNYDKSTGNPILQSIQSSLVGSDEAISCFNGIKSDIRGSGYFVFSLSDQYGNVLGSSSNNFNIGNFPPGDFYTGINQTTEKISITFSNQPVGSQFALNYGQLTITKIDIYGIGRYKVRPAKKTFIIVSIVSSGGLVEIQTESAHGFSTNQYINVYGVTGTVEANGNNQQITVIDSTHFTINGSTFTHTFTGGGIVYQW